MKKYFVTAIIAIMASCSTSSEPPKLLRNNGAGDTAMAEKSVHDINQQPVKTVVDFLKWYKANFSRIEKIEMVNNVPASKTFDSTQTYSVNFEATEKYLSEIRKSGFISDNYIDYWRQYFKKCDESFKKHPANDGPPEGFEFDFITRSQEYDNILADIGHLKLIKTIVNHNKATVLIELYQYNYAYNLTLQEHSWLIDSIESR